MYIVVLKTIAEISSKGAITWGTHDSKESFEKWYDGKMQSWYQVVEQGVTRERAIQLSSSLEATRVAIRSMVSRVIA